jgi:L,D-peptidoglycan transpeptidase YkuD (ErfK/YbiS/YcfS/YnhG family)
MNEWKLQNEKLFVFRDYSLTRDYAIESLNKSLAAANEANSAKTKLKDGVKTELDQLKVKIDKFEKYYKNLALANSTFNLFHSGKAFFLEAQIEYKKEDYMRAKKLLYKASGNISQAEKNAQFKLQDFFSRYPAWEKNKQLAFNLSKKGQSVLLVDKLQNTCTVLKGGKATKVFNADLGKSWMGDKIEVGDKATPEGIYKVVEKKSGSKTKYHKALLLDYPNKEDKKRFDSLVKLGKISKKSSIGGLIEIHGDGGKSVNWTDGCVALENKEMDVLYNLCAVNTPVIIVGSCQSMEDYLNSK